MATMTVSSPDPMKAWVEAQITNGDYASSSDDVRDLVRRDRERRMQEISIEELRSLVADAKASGVGPRSIDDIVTQAKDIARARARGSLRE
ncbi:ribbon-helix-helix domain-containing protein [Methylobacterium sp. SyP6R]|uniref:ribbon-helix-helix domain-containing protein n=1 Tax=Methylobacterium sp. SyP6R TaxID=2718876 RepID=UPI001F3A1F90|nr:type II toxin-antitoxin system ParD family antitoxin [Methylobacterium sp. SyP6R]MCF4129675.1 type II toxin-antitoxin system ParD family antitoxin [Methylobacterium sp. SyP6R]